MLDNLTNVFLTFIIYSFIGYILEVIYATIYYKKLTNRGFLFGPLCPIYGIGAILITYALSSYYKDPVIVFVFGVIITSLVEYYTSYILEKWLHNKWWDYSDNKFNINGRICLFNSLLFGIGSLLIIYVGNPLVNLIFNNIPVKVLNISAIVLCILTFIDFIISSMIAYNLRHKIIIAEELKSEKIKMIPRLLKSKYAKEISKLKIASNRLIKSFPNLNRKYDKELKLIDKWEKEEKKKRTKKKN